MSALMFHLFIFDSFNNEELIQYFISLYGEVVLANWGMPGPESDFIYSDYFLRYISQKLELMYHKSYLRHNVEIKDNIFDKRLSLHNRTHE